MRERTVKIDVLSWKTPGFSPWDLPSRCYLEEFRINPDTVNTWGLTKNSAWVTVQGLQVQGYWPEGFNWEMLKVLAKLEPHTWDYKDGGTETVE